jgi:hypothetical protein
VVGGVGVVVSGGGVTGVTLEEVGAPESPQLATNAATPTIQVRTNMVTSLGGPSTSLTIPATRPQALLPVQPPGRLWE